MVLLHLFWTTWISKILNKVNEVELNLLIWARAINTGVVHALVYHFCNIAMIHLPLRVFITQIKHVLHYRLAIALIILVSF